MERTILSSLLHNEEYVRTVIPFLKAEYFENNAEADIFGIINDHIQTYNKLPTLKTLAVELATRKADINEFEYKEMEVIAAGLKKEDVPADWLLAKTEKWCQDRSLYNAIMKSASIYHDNTGKLSRGDIPGLLTDALGVCFDSHIGMDPLEDAAGWHDRMHNVHAKIPFDIDILNTITKNGLRPSTLTILMGGTGFGKSLWMCHMAAYNLMFGKKVLYITLEMDEDQVSERIYANILNIPLDDLDYITKEAFLKKVEKVKEKTLGKLKVKEYPNGSAGAANFRHLLNELRIKEKFIPDIIYVDYLNICKSSTVKYTGAMNSYTYIKFITEEVRGLAKEAKIPIVSATQFNREGFASSDPGLDDISDSFGMAFTGDIIWAIILNDDLKKMGQYLIKQVKNRYGDITKYAKVAVGVDFSRMKLFNVEKKAQTYIQTVPDQIAGPLSEDADKLFAQEPPEAEPRKLSISERAMANIKRPTNFNY